MFRLLDASLTASGSRDCSLKMAFILSQVKNLHAKILLLLYVSFCSIKCNYMHLYVFIVVFWFSDLFCLLVDVCVNVFRISKLII